MINPQWVLRVTPELDIKAQVAAKKMSISKSEFIKFAVSKYVFETLKEEDFEEISSIVEAMKDSDPDE